MTDFSLYTRMGDGGMTMLSHAVRVPKTHALIEALGALDELNSVLGLVVALLKREFAEALEADIRLLEHAQRTLFHIGSALRPVLPRTDAAACIAFGRETEVLEHRTDVLSEGDGGALRGFVLPGGHPVAAQVHVARGVCRRAEVCVWRALEAMRRGVPRDEGEALVPPEEAPFMPYLNRLSDYLFALARGVNLRGGVEEVWL